jgi:hypothetical protein
MLRLLQLLQQQHRICCATIKPIGGTGGIGSDGILSLFRRLSPVVSRRDGALMAEKGVFSANPAIG